MTKSFCDNPRCGKELVGRKYEFAISKTSLSEGNKELITISKGYFNFYECCSLECCNIVASLQIETYRK